MENEYNKDMSAPAGEDEAEAAGNRNATDENTADADKGSAGRQEDAKPAKANDAESGKKDKGKKDKAKTGPRELAPVAYAKGISAEMKRVTWPSKREVLVWGLIVTAVIALFALLMFVMDNFIATPIMYAISGASADDGFGTKALLLTIAFFLTGAGTAIGVMLHAGGDSNGLSDNLSTQLTGGSAIAEKNLDRITIVMAVMFAIVLILMMVFFPHGTVTGA